MVFQSTDRTAEVEQGSEELTIYPTDFCRYYKRHPHTILWKKDCWTCTYGDFGVNTCNPTDIGICRYKKPNHIAK